MRTIITLLITFLCVAKASFAGFDPAEPAEQIEVVCAFCEDLRALQLFNGSDISQETPFLITLKEKCKSECNPEENSSGELKGETGPLEEGEKQNLLPGHGHRDPKLSAAAAARVTFRQYAQGHRS